MRFGLGLGAAVRKQLGARINSAPFILLLTNTEENPSQASLNKTVARPVGTATVSPLTTAQVLDVDGSDLNSIALQISGILDAEETLTIGDAVIDLSADASDTTEIMGVTFSIEYVQATGMITIAEVDDALLDESDEPILDESDQPVLAEA